MDHLYRVGKLEEEEKDNGDYYRSPTTGMGMGMEMETGMERLDYLIYVDLLLPLPLLER